MGPGGPFGWGPANMKVRSARAAAITGAVVASLVAGVAVFLMVLVADSGNGGGARQSAPTETQLAPATPTNTPAATSTPTATATASATALPVVSLPSVVAGKPVKELVAGPPVEFPENTVIYVATSACANCGWAPGNLWRIYRNRDGQLIADHTSPAGYVPVYALSADASLLIAGVCTGYCGGEEEPSKDAELRFVVSRDGGITWAAIDGPALPRTYVFFGGWYGDEVLANATVYVAGKGIDRVVYLLPSFRKIEAPAGVPVLPAFSAAIAQVGPRGELIWLLPRSSPPLRFDAEGNATSFAAFEAIIPGVDWRDRTYGDPNRGGTGVWFALGGTTDAQSFFVQTDAAGAVVAGYTTRVEGVTFAARFSATEWLGTAHPPLAPGESPIGGNDNSRAVLIDTTTGLMHPIKGLPRDTSVLPGNFAWPRLAVRGTFWRVNTGGSCLNVRQAASTSSATLGCYADGVLLREREAGAPPGWRAVFTPAGGPGFVANEYVE